MKSSGWNCRLTLASGMANDSSNCCGHSGCTVFGPPGCSSTAKPVSWANAVSRSRSAGDNGSRRSEEHTSELQSLMRISYAVFCLKKKKKTQNKEDYMMYTHTNAHDEIQT